MISLGAAEKIADNIFKVFINTVQYVIENTLADKILGTWQDDRNDGNWANYSYANTKLHGWRIDWKKYEEHRALNITEIVNEYGKAFQPVINYAKAQIVEKYKSRDIQLLPLVKKILDTVRVIPSTHPIFDPSIGNYYGMVILKLEAQMPENKEEKKDIYVRFETYVDASTREFRFRGATADYRKGKELLQEDLTTYLLKRPNPERQVYYFSKFSTTPHIADNLVDLSEYPEAYEEYDWYEFADELMTALCDTDDPAVFYSHRGKFWVKDIFVLDIANYYDLLESFVAGELFDKYRADHPDWTDDEVNDYIEANDLVIEIVYYNESEYNKYVKRFVSDILSKEKVEKKL